MDTRPRRSAVRLLLVLTVVAMLLPAALPGASLDELKKMVDSANVEDRIAAVPGLIAAEGDEPVRILEEMIQETSDRVRREVANAVLEQRDERYVPVYRAGLRLPDAAIVEKCAEMLIRLEDRDSVSRFRKLLDSEYVESVRVAVRALGEFQDAKSTRSLLSLLEKNTTRADARLYSEILAALEKIKDPRSVDRLVELIDRDPYFNQQLLSTILTIGGWKDRKVRRFLGSSRAVTTFSAAAILASQNDPEAVKKLSEAAKGNDRLLAVRAMGVSGNKTFVPQLLAILRETDDFNLSYKAIFALGDIGDRSAAMALEKIREQKSNPMISSAIDVVLDQLKREYP